MLYLLAIPAAAPGAGAVNLSRPSKNYGARRNMIVEADRHSAFYEE